MDYLWTVKEIRRACGVKTKGADFDVHGVSIDSRTVQKGDVFIALKNEKDGHEFVQKAYENGAVCAVVDHAVDCEIEQVIVEDTFVALNAMADAQRSWATSGKRIAITGSCGKTSTKELLASALQCHKSEASYNNHWGVPLTLARMPRDEDYSVFEMGMNNPGEIAPLSKMVKPHVAIVTNVAPAHIGAFGSVDGIRKEKLSIREGLQDETQLIVPLDLYEENKDEFNVKPYTFSLEDSGQADAYAESILENVSGQQIVASIMGEMVSFHLNLHGRHQVLNALASLLAVKLVGADVQAAVTNLSTQEAVEGRGKVYNVNGVVVIDESYNANPRSMEVSLETLRKRMGMRRRVAILGQMLELGTDSEKMHADLVKYCEGLDTVITVGEDMKALYDALPKEIQSVHYNSQKDVNVQKLATQLDVGDIVMVKGSKGTFWVWNFVPRLIKEIERLSQGLEIRKA